MDFVPQMGLRPMVCQEIRLPSVIILHSSKESSQWTPVTDPAENMARLRLIRYGAQILSCTAPSSMHTTMLAHPTPVDGIRLEASSS